MIITTKTKTIKWGRPKSGNQSNRNMIDTCNPASLDNNVYCLTCGMIPKEANQVEMVNVGIHFLKNWLVERTHYVNDNDNVLLCDHCKEEAIR